MPKCQFLVFCCFWFQKSTSANILGIARNKRRRPYFFQHRHGVRRRDEGGRRGGQTTPRCGRPPGRAALWCGPLETPPTPPLRLYIASDAKTLKYQVIFPEEFRSAAAIDDKFRGDRSLCSGTPPGRGSAPGAISIDSTAIFIAAADSHDEEGVVLPLRLRALPVAMWFISLSHGVIFM